jgi:short subunit dehydrogenase-like uncharacterized protein
MRGCAVVIHCAGPFQRTVRAMADACLRNKVHYTDLTGEISVFEQMAARGEQAAKAGVMFLPGAGFDVVPSDCLAAHLHRRLPDATWLTLAFHGGTGLSRGTATTMVENIDQGGAIRRDGKITRVPAAWRERDIDFGDKVRHTVTIPWGDVSTAFHSTQIPNIEVYTAAPPSSVRMMRLARLFGPLLATAPAQRFLKSRIQAGAPGPSDTARANARARLWGEAWTADGRGVAARLVTPDGYTLTARTAVAIARKILEGRATPGFRTPSRAFGADLILEVDDTERIDLPDPTRART